MKISFIVFLLFYVSLSFSQMIQVLDKDDKKPVPYVTFLLLNQGKILGGNYCDEKGFITIDHTIVFDQIELSCIGYETKVIEKYALNDKTIFLKNKIINLDEVVISKNIVSTSLLGYTDFKKNQVAFIGKGIETVVFIENSEKKSLFIKSFLFKVGKLKSKIAIRIHFYKKRVDKFEPGEEIFVDDVVEYLHENTNGVVEINIGEYGLQLPIDGGFVGVESLGVFDEKTKKYEDAKLFDDNLGLEYNSKLQQSLTYARNRFKVKQWRNYNDDIRKVMPNVKTNLNLSFGIKVCE